MQAVLCSARAREGEEKKQSEVDIYRVFEDLEVVYSNQELETFLENLID